MKRFLSYLFMGLFLLGCAAGKTSTVKALADPRKEALSALAQNLRAGFEALDKKDDVKASEAFIKAFRQARALDDEGRAAINTASEDLKKVVDISGFEYAKKESFSLLLVYLQMINAYMDSDAATLQSLAAIFNTAYLDVQQKTAEEKQKHIEELGTEITQKREEIQKSTESALLETYTTIYMVKKGDTMPSIAARHEIYNDSFMWPLIYKANRDQIKDPKVLYAGQDLKIPREMTMEEIVEARREAGAPEPEKIPKDAYLPKGKKK
ncbi:MAG TPA: LysM peptidoglycan-binding domain-containing protein [Desulfomonilia bacterium]|nr:LysM peptidoglycan-binding domain-containing protein [Desulfomonilia bacterium]